MREINADYMDFDRICVSDEIASTGRVADSGFGSTISVSQWQRPIAC